MGKIQFNNSGTLVQGKKVQLSIQDAIKNAKKIQKNVGGVITTLWQGFSDRFAYSLPAAPDGTGELYILDELLQQIGAVAYNTTDEWGHTEPLAFNASNDTLTVGASSKTALATTDYSGNISNRKTITYAAYASSCSMKNGNILVHSGVGLYIIDTATNTIIASITPPRLNVDTSTYTYSYSFRYVMYNPINDSIYVILSETSFRVSTGETNYYYIYGLKYNGLLTRIDTAPKLLYSSVASNGNIGLKAPWINNNGDLMLSSQVGDYVAWYLYQYDTDYTVIRTVIIADYWIIGVQLESGEYLIAFYNGTSYVIQIAKYDSTLSTQLSKTTGVTVTSTSTVKFAPCKNGMILSYRLSDYGLHRVDDTLTEVASTVIGNTALTTTFPKMLKSNHDLRLF